MISIGAINGQPILDPSDNWRMDSIECLRIHVGLCNIGHTVSEGVAQGWGAGMEMMQSACLMSVCVIEGHPFVDEGV